MRLCVLQPDYTASEVDYRHYDPPRDLAPLLPHDHVDHLFLRKSTTYRQLREAAARRYDIFVNLCEGYLDWDIPSVDVISSLDALGLPYTGPGLRLYDPSKELMKYVAHTRGVPFPPFVLNDCDAALRRLRFPLFVKPAHAGDSLGIDAASLVTSESALRAKCAAVVDGFGDALIEEFIPGREFTVLVAAHPADRFEPVVLQPIEFVFPAGALFKTYDLKVTQYHPECNIPVTKAALDARLRRAAAEMFVGFEGEGYARLDFRMDAAGDLYFLDINFACSVFYPPGSEGAADYILQNDPLGRAGFLRHIVAEGIGRHRRRQKLYERRGNAISGFGIYAVRAIRAGEVVFRGEERAQRLVTMSHVERCWPTSQIDVLRRYSLPTGGDVRILWDEDPNAWAPQNHSCDPNTAYRGLNLIAIRDIPAAEELTLDYAACCDETMAAFQCSCGSPNCRGAIEFSRSTAIGENANSSANRRLDTTDPE
jgi:D-alanine-D-alanine ligase-like ATP-grasp enzyme